MNTAHGRQRNPEKAEKKAAEVLAQARHEGRRCGGHTPAPNQNRGEDATSPQRAHAAAYIYDRENSYVDLAEQTQKSTYSNYAFSSVLDGRTDNSSTFPSTPLASSSMQNIIRRISRLFMPLRRGQVRAPEFTLTGGSPSMTGMDARGSIPITDSITFSGNGAGGAGKVLRTTWPHPTCLL